MRRVRAWIIRIAGVFGNLFNRSKRDRELSAELESHLQLHVDDNLSAGMSPQEARRRAIIKLGGIESTKENYRERRSIPIIETLVQDVRFGLRMLRRNPGFATVAVLTLALGIGANSAIFSLINSLLLRPLPVPQPTELFLLKWKSQQPAQWKSYYHVGACEEDVDQARMNGCGFSFAAFDQIRANAAPVADVTAIAGAYVDITVGSGTEHTEATADYVSGDFFSVLQVPAYLGRTILLEDDHLGANPVAVISYNLWRERFADDPSAIGRTIVVYGTAFTVVGVAPKDFPGVNRMRTRDLWIPAHTIAQFKRRTIWTTPDTSTPSFAIIARLKHKVSPEYAEAVLTSAYGAAMANDPKHPFSTGAQPEILLTDFSHGAFSPIRKRFGQPLLILMAIVSCVLLIACANVASLNLARASARSAEIAVRFALGAGRGRLLQQLFTESILVAFAGAAIGFLLSIWLTNFLAAFVGHGLSAQPLLNVKPSALVLAYTAGIATLSALFFGLLPAITISRVNPAGVMKASGSAAGEVSSRRRPLTRVLVTAQVSVALILLIGAGLFLRTLINLKFLNTGFDKQHVLVFSTSLFNNSDAQGPEALALNNELRARLSALPGVASVSWANAVFLDGGYGSNVVTVEKNGKPEDLGVRWLVTGPEIFETLGIPILAGRDVELDDLHKKSDIIWINQSLARRIFPGENPLGKKVLLHTWRTVVGVVGDTKYDNIRDEMPMTVFEPALPDIPAYNIMIRTMRDPSTLATAVRQVVHGKVPDATVYDVKTESELLDRQLFYERLMARLSAIFGLLALLLTCVGVYGVLAYATARRTGEIAIRISLGAMPWDILRLIVSDGLRPAVAGAFIGLLGCIALTHLLTKFLYGIKPFDPFTFCAATLLLLAVAAIACYIPARRATCVDPATSLKHE
jgi:predicted permease